MISDMNSAQPAHIIPGPMAVEYDQRLFLRLALDRLEKLRLSRNAGLSYR